jgi:hypothetical protein
MEARSAGSLLEGITSAVRSLLAGPPAPRRARFPFHRGRGPAEGDGLIAREFTAMGWVTTVRLPKEPVDPSEGAPGWRRVT